MPLLRLTLVLGQYPGLPQLGQSLELIDDFGISSGRVCTRVVPVPHMVGERLRLILVCLQSITAVLHRTCTNEPSRRVPWSCDGPITRIWLNDITVVRSRLVDTQIYIETENLLSKASAHSITRNVFCE